MRILLAGYYGYNNLGDELLCRTIGDILINNHHQVTVLSRVNRKVPKLLALVWQNECLLFGGGSLLQDVSGRGLTIVFYAGLAILAKLLGKKVFFVGQGIGPVRKNFNIWLVRKALMVSDFVSVRNKESAAFLQAAGINKFFMANDLFFAAKVKFNAVNNKRKKIVFSFRPLNFDYAKELVLIMQELATIPNTDFYIVPMHAPFDEQIIAPLKKIPGVHCVAYNQEKIIQTIAQADLAVGMRMHFLLLAAKHHVPFIGIAYDPKVTALCRQLRMSYIEVNKLAELPALIISELPRRKIRTQQMVLALRCEEAIAREAVINLLERLDNAKN